MLIITGSGRCGTSFMAHMAKGLGCNPGGGWSPEINAGFEQIEIAAMNSEISEKCKANDVHVVAAEYRDRINAITSHCIKDPRFVALSGVLKVWMLVRRDLEFLFLYRSPVAAARSSIKAFKRVDSQVAVLRLAKETDRKIHEALATMAAGGVPFHVANFPLVTKDREHCRKALDRGPMKNVDNLLFNRIWRETIDSTLVHFPDEQFVDLIGPSMRPGHPTYAKVGELYARAVINAVGIGNNVLDIGCGFGRVAEQLARNNWVGSYMGLDCFAPAIVECQARYSMNPLFQFEHLNLHSARYNPEGVPIEGEFLQQPDDTYHAALGISLWTHLNEDDAQAFLGEARRVLKSGGKLLATWFLVHPEDEQPILDGASAGPLRVEVAPGVWTSGGLLENAVGYSREMVLGWYAAAGFEVEFEEQGNWHGNLTGTHFQDFIIARV